MKTTHPSLLKKASSTQQAGFSMIEILIALLIMAIGVLGLAGMQMHALGLYQSSHHAGQALNIASDLIERTRLHDSEDAQENYWAPTGDIWTRDLTTGTQPTDCQASECTVDKLIEFDIWQIRQMADELLPNGQVLVQRCPGASVSDISRCVTVGWTNYDVAAAATAGAACADNEECLQLEYWAIGKV